MKKKRFLVFILVFSFLLTLPAFASSNRASDQIHRRDVRVTALTGQLYVKASVYGMGIMNKIGTESIFVYRENGSSWLLCEAKGETADGMTSSNTVAHMGAYYFDTEAGVNYRVVVTVFAENDAGRDSRTDIFYVTGK